MDGYKFCKGCGQWKLFHFFYKNRARKGGLEGLCISCINEHRATIKSLTVEEYDTMLEQQGGGCKVCGRTPEDNGKRLAVDHNHSTGRIRGLLCDKCNVGLGHLGDSLNRVLKAAEYLAEDILEQSEIDNRTGGKK